MERKELFQYQRTISVPREAFIENVVENADLTVDDLRVCLLLMTELNGWDNDRKVTRAAAQDPANYKQVNVDAMSEALGIKKKKIRRSLEILCEHDIIEAGGSRAAIDGYRFTF